MFAYKLLLSTFDAIYIDTSVVSWFHLHFLLRQTKKLEYLSTSSCALLHFWLIWIQTQEPEEMDIG